MPRTCLKNETYIIVDFGYMMKYYTSHKLFCQKRHVTKFMIIFNSIQGHSQTISDIVYLYTVK